jgi:N6-adenosine-specific RNA methylase IME4
MTVVEIIKTTKYSNTVAPLTKDEYEALKKSIAENGLYSPIIKNQHGDILDGHHRLKACRELGITSKFEIKYFDNELLEELFVYDSNLFRRQLTPYHRGELVLKKKPVLAKLAEQRMKAGITLSRNQERVHVDKELAKEARVSKDTLYKIDQIIKSDLSEQEKEKLRTEKMRINRAYKKVKRSEDSKKEKPPLPTGQFDVILADPPWSFDVNARGTPEDHYSVMTDEEIKQLKIPATDNAVLFLWIPSSKNKDAFSVMDAWGFQYKSKIIWVRDKLGIGYHVRGMHEELLICIKGNGLGLPAEEDRPESVFDAPRGKHSKKPEKVYSIIEKMYPGHTYLEMFARGEPRNGWTAWGLEAK